MGSTEIKSKPTCCSSSTAMSHALQEDKSRYGGTELALKNRFQALDLGDQIFSHQVRKEVAGGIMAGEFVTFGIQKLWDLLSREQAQFRGVEDQVTELKADINTLKSFVRDAEAKKHTSARVRNCVDVIKEIIFDAEDIIETFILKEELGKDGGINKRIRRLACIIPERRNIALEMGNLSKRILKVIRDMETYGVQQIIADVRDPLPLQERPEFAREYESNLVGVEANVEKLVGYLVNEDNVQVVSMTGMGGLGKTTLARQAFHHHKVKEKFDRQAWVCVSQICDRKNVWQTILQNFRPKEEEKKIMEMTESGLQDELFGLLETSKSLIVFDDIWKEEDWGLIKTIFPHKTGWRVLLTSRNDSIAGRGETHINFKPEYLSDQDSWTLFQRIAMPRKDAYDKHLSEELKNVAKEMEEMGKQMIEHCEGLPLAVQVLGGLLAAKYTVHDWKRLSENIGSHLVGRNNDDKNKSFNRVLSMSYEELPGYLKYCFLYLAHFPEDFEIDIEKLSYSWAAEKILRYNDGESIRDVGDSYIEELVRRNMVISERDNTTSRFETCRLHDVMREICISKAEEENFLQFVGIRSPAAHSQSLSSSRRFVSQSPATLDVEREIINPKVRSLMVICKHIRRNSWKLSCISFTRLQLLRVLHLPAAEFEGGKLPDSIGKLIHLGYLNLKASRISHLHSSLRDLKLLIYLDLDIISCSSLLMPNVLMGMKELRYLALPYGMDKKTKLELSDLVNLEKLINFSTENSSLEDLRGMGRLRTLKIYLTGENSLEILSASIAGLRHLENLHICYPIGAKMMKEWGTLFGFNNLKELKLSIETPLLSGKIEFPSRLTGLYLRGGLLEEDPMPILEKLCHLETVQLLSNSFCGRRMVCSVSGFPQLKFLELCGLMELEELIVEEGCMPLLYILKIIACEKLKELPDGLRFITSLKHLTINMGTRVDWVQRLFEGGEDYHKVQHIPYVTIR